MKTPNDKYPRGSRNKGFKPLAILMAMTAAPIAGVAHDGAHLTRIVSDVTDVSTIGTQMALELTVSNFSHELVTLQSISTQNADVAAVAPTEIAPGEQAEVQTIMVFSQPIPGIFTAVLDFGEAGQGPVLVIH